ncbi:MAG: flippase-like domain-containing protein, partial [Candidatus Eisenbacteria bacterium]|nr:flippase-like domain-containing protein [Candidatus Eisenbacteria bacterium]
GSLVGVVVCGFHSLGLELPTDAGVIVLVVMAIGTMIPSAPGFIGTLQYAGTLALKQYGVDPSLALSFTLIYHASQWFPVTGLGFFYFVRQQMSLKGLVAADSGRPSGTPIPRGIGRG